MLGQSTLITYFSDVESYKSFVAHRHLLSPDLQPLVDEYHSVGREGFHSPEEHSSPQSRLNVGIISAFIERPLLAECRASSYADDKMAVDNSERPLSVYETRVDSASVLNAFSKVENIR